MNSVPLSQAAVDLGIRDQMAQEVETEAKRKKRDQGKPQTPMERIMSPAATMLFGDGGY